MKHEWSTCCKAAVTFDTDTGALICKKCKEECPLSDLSHDGPAPVEKPATGDDKQAILGRVKKLLTLANDKGATLGEATNSFRLAQKMMAKYGLSLADLSGEQIRSQVTEMKLQLSYAKFQGWHLPVIRCLQMAFDVKILLSNWHDPTGKWGTYNKKALILIGQDCDVEVASYFFEFLNRDIYALAEAEAEKNHYRGHQRSDFRVSFISGACETIGERLKADRDEMMKADPVARTERHPESQGEMYAMVLVKKEHAIEEYMDEKYPDTTTVKMSSGGRSAHGRAQGREAGRTMELRKGIRGGGTAAGRLEG